MGLCIEADENEQGVDVEIRRESVVIGEGETEEMKFHLYPGLSDTSRNNVEFSKAHLRKLVSFFTRHPEHLLDD